MNAQPANGKNQGHPIEGDEPFVPRTLLDYAAPQATNARVPIRLSYLWETHPVMAQAPS
jgi:hypothetical protein